MSPWPFGSMREAEEPRDGSPETETGGKLTSWGLIIPVELLNTSLPLIPLAEFVRGDVRLLTSRAAARG